MKQYTNFPAELSLFESYYSTKTNHTNLSVSEKGEQFTLSVLTE